MKENLLLITFDQWRGDWADPNSPVVNLPNLAKMKSRGVHYKRCYTSSPQCIPARLSWLSGKMPSIFGVTKNLDCSVKKEFPSIFKKLKEKNYYTQLIGKTHWTSHAAGQDLRTNKELFKQLGFDHITDIAGPRALRNIKCELTEEWIKNNIFEDYVKDLNYRYRQDQGRNAWQSKPTVLPEEFYPDIWIARKGEEAIRKLPNKQPWFLWISFVGPHEPFDTPLSWRTSDGKSDIPKQITSKNWIRNLEPTTELYKANKKWFDSFDEIDAKGFREDYADNLRLLDSLLKNIDLEIRSREDHRRTKTIITADHGEMLGDYGMLYKSTFLEPAIRVPMLIIDNRSNQKEETIENAVNSTDIIKENIELISSENLKQNASRKKVVIEYAEERCFILDNLKLVTTQDNKILWTTKILRDGTKERIVRGEKRRGGKDSRKWDRLIRWAGKMNKQLNKEKNKLAYCLKRTTS